MSSALEVSVLFALIGVVFWIGGGPPPRTRAAWLLLVAILIVAALPALLCWAFCQGRPANPAESDTYADQPATTRTSTYRHPISITSCPITVSQN